jgi:hypothetical protein
MNILAPEIGALQVGKMAIFTKTAPIILIKIREMLAIISLHKTAYVMCSEK